MECKVPKLEIDSLVPVAKREAECRIFLPKKSKAG